MFRKQVRTMLLSFVNVASYFDACLAQSGTEDAKACAEVGRGLHATLNARAGFAGDLSLETAEFQLMNDSEQTKWRTVTCDSYREAAGPYSMSFEWVS